MLSVLAFLGASIWLIILILPWRPWSTREQLEADPKDAGEDLQDITVLIPARNEETEIGETLHALQTQGEGLKVVVVNDQSADRTAEKARKAYDPQLISIVDGKPLESGWAGKLWALEQGRLTIQSEFILLHDADIKLAPGILKSLKAKMQKENLGFISLMAALRMENFWEKLLIPAYIYFFKLLFPFHLSNSANRHFASAAGGCILVRRKILEEIGGFAALRDAFIDDCTLAALVKSYGHRSWTGMTHSVTSHRAYEKLTEIWNLVARFAFTYLRYSSVLLILCSLILVAAFWALPAALIFKTNADTASKLYWTCGLASMVGVYLPTLRFYKLSPFWTLLKPIAGTLYLLMTWSSALRYWRGQRTEWKGRVYNQRLENDAPIKDQSAA
ncbi:MAG: glycosyl transferase [Deltaproteobacteria bacterium CG11_big_fil_rev_8_21_14_0_20_45_16]|nr:MAG: glycosyl transferase [Deltaproteobacteria bacterium CG11_big_fil_rev_8_21_14_0_20_45_16]